MKRYILFVLVVLVGVCGCGRKSGHIDSQTLIAETSNQFRAVHAAIEGFYWRNANANPSIQDALQTVGRVLPPEMFRCYLTPEVPYQINPSSSEWRDPQNHYGEIAIYSKTALTVDQKSTFIGITFQGRVIMTNACPDWRGAPLPWMGNRKP